MQDANSAPLIAMDKLLVHLIDYHELPKDEVHPREQTQEGISENIGVTRPTATKLLKKLYKAGLVRYSRHVRVKSMGVKRRTYHLTETGRRRALHLSAIMSGILADAPEREKEPCLEPLEIGRKRFGVEAVHGRRPLPNLR